jgi:hypothetical protein
VPVAELPFVPVAPLGVEKVTTQPVALSSQPGQVESVVLSSQQPEKRKRVSRLKAETANVLNFQEVKAKLSSQQASAEYDEKRWKLSRIKASEGVLIKRIKGYDLVENEYGVAYLKRLGGRNKTSADTLTYPFAGFFNWQALAVAGRLSKVSKQDEQAIG